MISGYLIGDRDLVARLSGLPATVKPILDTTVQRLGYMVKATSQRDWLRGPRPRKLGVKTGRLINSIAVRFEFTPRESYAYVGTNVTYGIAWERGFTRKVGAGARGGLFWNMSPGALATYWAKHPPGLKAMGARPFLAPALLQDRAKIVTEISAALNDAAVKALKV